MADLFATVLLEASYEGVVFPVADATTEGGHDAVEHVAFGRRGADVEPTGQRSYHGTLHVPLINGLARYGGDLFPGRYGALLAKFEATPIGLLAHPTKGSLRAHIRSWSERAAPGVRNGVMLDVDWVEHVGTAAVLRSDRATTPTDTPTSAQLQAIEADAAMETAAPGAYTPLTDLFAATLGFLELEARTFQEISAAVASLLAPINADLALAVFADAAAHPAVAALEALRATTYALRDRYLGTLARPRTYVVPTTQPLWQVAQTLYGDASKATLLAAVNPIADPIAVRAGRALIVPPV